jgi:vesicle transport protein GOT1
MNGWLTDRQKIAAFFTALGIAFIFFGIVLLMDRGLLAIGNLLFLLGLLMLIGLQNTWNFFVKQQNLRVSVCFWAGVILVVVGWAWIGMALELYGATGLFYDFLPVVLSFGRRMPVISTLLDLPGIRQLCDRIVQSGRLPV